MNIAALTFAISMPDYAEFALDCLRAYYAKYEIPLTVIDKIPEGVSVKHPSWLKLICHDLINADYIICQDLDLLPTNGNTSVLCFVDKIRLSLVPDEAAPFTKYPHFKYNCGLMGVPKSEAGFLKNIFDTYRNDPNNWPSWEQYYVNNVIGETKHEVCEMPLFMNQYWNPSVEYEKFSFVHYTYNIPQEQKRSHMLQHHPKWWINQGGSV